jgi:hypothetical protein
MVLLIALRDAVIALALAWVGVSVEQRDESRARGSGCEANVCVGAQH